MGVAAAAPALADGQAPKRIIAGWVPYWLSTQSSSKGVSSAVGNADLMSEVSPFWYSATDKPGGGVQVGVNRSFTGGAASAAWATAQFKAAGLPVLPSIADGSGKGTMAATLANPALRTAHVNDIVQLVQPGVRVWMYRPYQRDYVMYDTVAVIERFGFEPERIVVDPEVDLLFAGRKRAETPLSAP